VLSTNRRLGQPAAVLGVHLPAAGRDRSPDGSSLRACGGTRWFVHGRRARRVDAVRTRHLHEPLQLRHLVRLVPDRSRRAAHLAAHSSARRSVGRHPRQAPSCQGCSTAQAGTGGAGMTMLRVRDMGMRFGGLVALQGVSLDLNRGEILGLIGPNGAGKTTLFNCISGLLNPTEGGIFFEGRSLRFAPPHERARRGIARTFQNLQLWDSMTVLENLELPIDAAGNRNTLSDALGLPFSHYAERAAAERARAILHVLELDPFVNRLAGDLPAGIQRRVEPGRVIAAYLGEAGAELSEPGAEAVEEPTIIVRSSGPVHNGERAEATTVVPAASSETESQALAARGEPLLEVTGLAAGYGRLEVIRDIALNVHAGEVVACIGANGAGKTTTLRAISGVIHARSRSEEHTSELQSRGHL